MHALARTLLTTGAAILAVTGLLTTLAPAAHATSGSLTAVTVGDPALPGGDHAVTLANNGPVTFTIGANNFGCTAITFDLDFDVTSEDGPVNFLSGEV